MSDDGWGSENGDGFGASLEALAAQSALETFQLLQATDDKLFGDAEPVREEDKDTAVEQPPEVPCVDGLDGEVASAPFNPWGGGVGGFGFREPPPEPSHLEWQRSFVNLRVRGHQILPAVLRDDFDEDNAATETMSTDQLPVSAFVPACEDINVSGVQIVPPAVPTVDSCELTSPSSLEMSGDSMDCDEENEPGVNADGEEVFAAHGTLEDVLDVSWPIRQLQASGKSELPESRREAAIVPSNGADSTDADPSSGDSNIFAAGWCTDPRRDPPVSPNAAAQHEAAVAAVAKVWNTFVEDCRAARDANPELFR